jgi:hypothetical protein
MKVKKTPAKKEYKLNIFEALKQADLQNFSWYSQLDDSEKKGFTPLIFMRWMTCVEDRNLQPFYLQMINQYANTEFWEFSRHPELLWKLMCICGSGTPQKRKYIPAKPGRRTKKLDSFILSISPSLSNIELDMVVSRMNEEKLTNIAQNAGLEDEQIKELLIELKNVTD